MLKQSKEHETASLGLIASFGNYLLTHLKVWTDEIDESLSDSDLVEALQRRPVGEALVLEHSSGQLRV